MYISGSYAVFLLMWTSTGNTRSGLQDCCARRVCLDLWCWCAQNDRACVRLCRFAVFFSGFLFVSLLFCFLWLISSMSTMHLLSFFSVYQLYIFIFWNYLVVVFITNSDEMGHRRVPRPSSHSQYWWCLSTRGELPAVAARTALNRCPAEQGETRPHFEHFVFCLLTRWLPLLRSYIFFLSVDSFMQHR